MGMLPYLAQVTFQGASGNPADVYVNTLHFEGPDVPTETQLSEILNHVADTWIDEHGGHAETLYEFMSEAVTQNGHTVKLYQANAVPPSLPLATLEFNLPTALGSGGLPEEVALCLSFRSGLVAGTNTGPGPHLPARKRNRFYFGPIGSGNTQFAQNATRPSAALVQELLAAAEWLAAPPIEWQWITYSPTAGTWDTVELAWVDNAFDTQRRRGAAPTGRSSVSLV